MSASDSLPGVPDDDSTASALPFCGGSRSPLFIDMPAWIFRPVGDTGMLKKNVHYFFRLGTLLGQFAAHVVPGVTRSALEAEYRVLDEALHRFLTNPFIPEAMEA